MKEFSDLMINTKKNELKVEKWKQISFGNQTYIKTCIDIKVFYGHSQHLFV